MDQNNNEEMQIKKFFQSLLQQYEDQFLPPTEKKETQQSNSISRENLNSIKQELEIFVTEKKEDLIKLADTLSRNLMKNSKQDKEKNPPSK